MSKAVHNTIERKTLKTANAVETNVTPLTKVSSNTQSLTVPSLNRKRSLSPDTHSLISLEDFSEFRLSRVSSWQPEQIVPDSPDWTEQPPTWRDSFRASWTKNKGLVLVVLAQIFGTFMAASTRILVTDGEHGSRLHPFQILFARFGITCLLSNLYMWYTKTPDFPLGPRGVRKLLVARGMGGFFGVFGFYWALQYLPISDAIVITFLAPFLTCLLTAKLMREPFTRAEQICGILSLCGIILIARPTALFSIDDGASPDPTQSLNSTTSAPLGNSTSSTPTSTSSGSPVTPQLRLAAVAMSMVGVFGAVCAYTTIRWIGQRAHPLISVNYFATWCLVISTICVTFVPDIPLVLPRNATEWGLLLFMGVSGFALQFLLTAGLSYSRDSRATLMVYTQMIFALAFDKWFWNITPALLSVLGSGLILGSAIFVAMQQSGGAASGGKTVDGEREAGVGDEELGLVEGMAGGVGREEVGSVADDEDRGRSRVTESSTRDRESESESRQSERGQTTVL